MITVNGIQVLCGATADQAANETGGQGFFTAALVATLRAPHDPPLLTLPLDLGAWLHALPAELLGPDVTILQDRAALVGSPPAPSPPAAASAAAPTLSRDMLDRDADNPAPPPEQRAEAV